MERTPLNGLNDGAYDLIKRVVGREGIDRMAEGAWTGGFLWAKDMLEKYENLIRNMKEAALIPAVDVKTSGNGVSFTRYKGDFLSTSEMLAKGTIDGKGVKPFFGIDEAEDEDHFGYVFDTWLKVEQTGIHQFNIISDDGAVMFVDGKEVLNVDGSHPDRSGWAILNLEKGMHHIELRYFEDFEAQKLDVVLTCPDGQNGPIPAERLFISAD